MRSLSTLATLLLGLAAVFFAPTAKAGDMVPEMRALWEAKAFQCGKLAQMGKSVGVSTVTHEAQFLMSARQDGAGDHDLQMLRFKYADGQRDAVRQRFSRGLELMDDGKPISGSKLEEFRASVANSLERCLSAIPQSIWEIRVEYSRRALASQRLNISFKEEADPPGDPPGLVPPEIT